MKSRDLYNIPDVQSDPDSRKLAIDKVGIKAIRHPVRIQERGSTERSPRAQHTIALFNMYVGGRPLVRQGGTLILFHPLAWEFDTLHHPSYVDFFEEVLAESTDPATIEAKFEKQYAEDPWYIHLYRTSYAYHGVHPFYMWYWISHALDHCGDIVWVGANRKTVERMGFRSASTLQDALEMVSHSVGRSPSITYLHNPPHLLADVR